MVPRAELAASSELPAEASSASMGAFEALGLSPTASKADVKTAYRSLAKKMHPDVNRDDPTAEEKFKRLTTAYTEALRESSRRPEMGGAARDYASGMGRSSHQGRTTRASWESRQADSGAGPTPSVDPRRYNVEEWERAHYGMHGARTDRYATNAERNVSDKVRQMRRQAQAMNRQAAAARAAPVGGGTSLGRILGAFAAVAGIWTLVFKTNEYNTALGGKALPVSPARGGASGRRRG